MKIFIGCSSKNEIDKKYLDLTEKVCEDLSQNNDLVFGADSNGMMGICYDVFKKHKKQITAIVNKKYEYCLNTIDCDKTVVVNDTFDRTQMIYNESDILLILPGGIGTFAELLSILENLRNSNDSKKLIIFNYENYYDNLLGMLNIGVNQKFINKDDLKYINIISSLEELREYI